MPASQSDEQPRVLLVITTKHIPIGLLVCAGLGLSLFVLRTYQKVYDPQYGWTELILFGSAFAKEELPRLQRVPHYLSSSPGTETGYDGQFFAQMALDPSLRDPAFDRALDEPAYRGRRIGLPAFAFAMAGAKPRRILQVYAVSNLFFWFVLLGALAVLFRPWTGQQILGLSAGLLSFGAIASMERSLVDLPAAALIFLGMALGSWPGTAAFAAAALTRETSLLAAIGSVHLRHPWATTGWKSTAGKLAVAVVPLFLWMAYVRHRFPGGMSAAGYGNFSWPLQAMFQQSFRDIRHLVLHGPGVTGRFEWWYASPQAQQVLGVTALLAQAIYFLWRRKMDAPLWRTGFCYVALWATMGPAVWNDVSQVARVLLPMTLCFYLLLARERPQWFWPFFVLGSLSVPYAVHDFWLFG